MGIRELARKYADTYGISRTRAQEIIESVIKVVEDGIVEDGRVQIIDHFTLEAVRRAEYGGNHPVTHERIQIPSKVVLKAKAGKKFSARLNG